MRLQVACQRLVNQALSGRSVKFCLEAIESAGCCCKMADSGRSNCDLAFSTADSTSCRILSTWPPVESAGLLARLVCAEPEILVLIAATCSRLLSSMMLQPNCKASWKIGRAHV